MNRRTDVFAKALLAFLLPLAGFGAGCYARRGEVVGREPILDESATRGRQVWLEYCQKCHPEGRAGVAPGIVDKPLPVAAMKLQVRKGIGTMPGFDETKISGAALDDLMSYIEALRHAGAAK
jgi:mono/diheme cytochrome c family protein